MRDNFYSLPNNLPIPQDDGACKDFEGKSLPFIHLQSTKDRVLDLSKITEPTVFFFYPRTGRPDESAPVGWDEIAGARGCTPQSCGYRDLYSEFKRVGVQIFGISTQTTEFQKELVNRIHLPFEILSDAAFLLTDKLNLPTFDFGGMRLLKRMSWYCENGQIKKVFYPVFPPDKNAEKVLRWIKNKDLPKIPNDPELKLVTERLIIEPVIEGHFEEMHMLFSDTKLHQYTSFKILTLDEQRKKCAQWATRTSPNKKEIWLNWAAREKVSNKVIAHFQAGLRDNYLATVGYLVSYAYQNKGIAAEGMSAIFEFLKSKMGIKEVRALTDVANIASHCLAKKLDMAQIGIIKDANLLSDQPSDDIVFSRTFD